MKKKLVLFLSLSLLLNIALIYFFVFRGDVIVLEDHRQAIVISKENKEVVLTEMRSFLESIQEINQGLIDNNVQMIIDAGTKAGNGVVEKVPKGLMRKLPIAFKRMGFATHDLFDEISQDAKDHFNAKKTQEKLAELLNNCVACHKTYKFTTE